MKRDVFQDRILTKQKFDYPMAPSVFCYAKSTSLPEGGIIGAVCVLGTVWKGGRSKALPYGRG